MPSRKASGVTRPFRDASKVASSGGRVASSRLQKELYEAAKKEGMVVSFDTGPEWANWKSLFRDFKKRYPDIEMTYNDIGSAAIGQVIVFAAAYGNGGSANNIKPGTDYRAETGFRVFPMRQSGVIALSVSYITTSVKVVVADQR